MPELERNCLKFSLPVKRQSSNSSLITVINLSPYTIQFNEPFYDFISTQKISTWRVGLIFAIIQAASI